LSPGVSIQILASAVAAFGSGPTGGVSRYSLALCRAVHRLGFRPRLLVPASLAHPVFPEYVEVRAVSGNYQPSGTAADQAHWPAVAGGVLGAMLQTAGEAARAGDVAATINLNHDWLPYWLGPLFPGRLLHVANLTAADPTTSAAILAAHARAPGAVACLGESHRDSLGLTAAPILACDLDPGEWPLGDGDGGYVAFCGRLAPEKGILEAARAAQAAGRRLRLAGVPDDSVWWREARPEIEATGAVEVGFLAGRALARFLGQAQCLVMAQTWQEAFGIAMAEAMLCGTPIAAVPRGANLEMVQDGITGALAETAAVAALAAAIERASALDRARVREAALTRFAVPAMATALERWLALA
jgi:UDP-glucose:tetrahydrobiopterin glucosyltransferase